MITVLRFVGLNVSTYYSLRRPKKHSKDGARRPGRKVPGYSISRQGEVVNDDTVKTMLLELIEGDGYPYGYRKLTVELQEDKNLIINHKKVYRLCKELRILRPQRVLKPYRPGQIGHKRKATDSNEHWEIDLKYGYIKGISQFFYQISIIDIFDRSIVESHIGLSAKAKDAARIVKLATEKRGVEPGRLVIRSDNGPQFKAKAFTEALHELKITHERIPVNSPNLNAYIESFHSILEDECYSRHEFETFQEAYEEVNNYLDYYNNRRRHGSIGYQAPAIYYQKHAKGTSHSVYAAKAA